MGLLTSQVFSYFWLISNKTVYLPVFLAVIVIINWSDCCFVVILWLQLELDSIQSHYHYWLWFSENYGHLEYLGNVFCIMINCTGSKGMQVNFYSLFLSHAWLTCCPWPTGNSIPEIFKVLWISQQEFNCTETLCNFIPLTLKKKSCFVIFWL